MDNIGYSFDGGLKLTWALAYQDQALLWTDRRVWNLFTDKARIISFSCAKAKLQRQGKKMKMVAKRQQESNTI